MCDSHLQVLSSILGACKRYQAPLLGNPFYCKPSPITVAYRGHSVPNAVTFPTRSRNHSSGVCVPLFLDVSCRINTQIHCCRVHEAGQPILAYFGLLGLRLRKVSHIQKALVSGSKMYVFKVSIVLSLGIFGPLFIQPPRQSMGTCFISSAT